MTLRSIKTFLILCLGFSVNLVAQKDDPILFSVEDSPVHVSEFQYIYSKTNGDKADFSKTSLEEYLDLYTKFKLKVKRAKDLKLDTIPALKRELDGYRQQLSKSYLMDKELTEKLVREAYDRSLYDVNISHLLASLPQNAEKDQEAAALKKINELYKTLEGGADFAQLAKTKSDDVSLRPYGGEIGYFKALQLPNLYELESAAYETPVGKYSKPIRTSLGYHIVKVNDKRKARGEMNAAHILARVKKNDPNATETAAKAKIDAIYARLKGGEDFAALAKAESSDTKTAAKGGELGFFGINVYETAFEDAAFGLKKDGEYSKPFLSSLGWHIIKRLEKKDMDAYEVEKGALLNKVKRDSRYSIAKDAMIQRIKDENKFKVNTTNLGAFYKSLDKDFTTAAWKAPKTGLDKPIFTIGDKQINLGPFTTHLLNNRTLRIRRAKGKTPQEVAELLFEDFASDQVIKYEESQLGKKYPEFQSLMREYEEGILLFEATKRLVWDKASADTVGLKQFYKENEEKYKWSERARVSIYSYKSADAKLGAKSRKLAAKKPASAVLSKLNKSREIVAVRNEMYEKGRNGDLDNLAWKKGTVSKVKEEKGEMTFMKIEEVLPATPKTLKEARGYVVADYQDSLEQQWVKELKKAYNVDINQAVLKSLIQ